MRPYAERKIITGRAPCREIAERAVRPTVVVIIFSDCSELSRRRWALEIFHGRKSASQPAVNALRIAVQLRAARMDVQRLDADLGEQRILCAGDELRAVLAAGRARHVAHGQQFRWPFDDHFAGAAIDLQREPFAGELLDDRQLLERTATRGAASPDAGGWKQG
ncbi:MAG: hypothetical protein IT424_04725 [Pirellulales bacterium]|nr:hypothetical protein [Pirellulales bacterium]